MTIKSRVHNYGNEKEASWPEQFGTGEKGIFHLDEEGKVQPGYPPDKNLKFGDAPMVIFDSMPKTYHEGACREIESRKEWELADKQFGTTTFSTIEEPRKYAEKGAKEKQKALAQDRRKASLTAYQAYMANPKEVSQKVQKQAEQQMEMAKKAGLTKLIKEQI